MSESTGVLYIVATPIGNLGDMTQRAVEVLNSVALIAAEDTRNSQKLLNHFAIQTPMMAFHEHNERDKADELITRLLAGESIALISDAGTPLISDPGYILVSHVLERGLKVAPIPGPSALTAALSVAGLATDRFCFEGFLPSKQVAREKRLETLKHESRTLVFYEAPHRLQATLQSLCEIFGTARLVSLTRELTKLFETVRRAELGDMLVWVTDHPEQNKGECVLVVAGYEHEVASDTVDIEVTTLLEHLLKKMSVKDAAHMVAEITGLKKNALYEQALQMQHKKA